MAKGAKTPVEHPELLQAMVTVIEALKPLKASAQARILRFVADYFKADLQQKGGPDKAD
jgi:hypothetical protein